MEKNEQTRQERQEDIETRKRELNEKREIKMQEQKENHLLWTKIFEKFDEREKHNTERFERTLLIINKYARRRYKNKPIKKFR